MLFNIPLLIDFMVAFDQFVFHPYEWANRCFQLISNLSFVISYQIGYYALALVFLVSISFKNIIFLWEIIVFGFKVCRHVCKNAPYSKGEQISWIFFIFLFIILANVSGLITFAFTVTAIIMVPLIIAYISFVWMAIFGITAKYWSSITQFLPKGLPLELTTFFVSLESVSSSSRLISISVRLFANMVAGHILLKILSSIFVQIVGIHYFWLCIFMFVTFTVVYALEFFVAILQGFVFTLLLNLYYNETIPESEKK